MTLSELENKSVGVILNAEKPLRAIVGTAQFEVHDTLGQVLRIFVPGKGNAQLLIQNSSWHGQIVSGKEWGCDWALIPSQLD